MFCDARTLAEELKASLTRVSTLMRRRCTEWDARTRPPPLGVAAHRAAMLGNLRPWVWWWRWWRRHLLTKVLQVGHVIHGHTPAPRMALAARESGQDSLLVDQETGPDWPIRSVLRRCFVSVGAAASTHIQQSATIVCNDSLQRQSGPVSVIRSTRGHTCNFIHNVLAGLQPHSTASKMR